MPNPSTLTQLAAEQLIQPVESVADFQPVLEQLNQKSFAIFLESVGHLLADEILESLIRDTLIHCCDVSLHEKIEQQLHAPKAIWDFLQTFLMTTLRQLPATKVSRNPRLESNILRVFLNMIADADRIIIVLAACRSFDGIGLLSLAFKDVRIALFKKVALPDVEEQKQHEVIFYLSYYLPNLLDTLLTSSFAKEQITSRMILALKRNDTLYGINKTLLLFRQRDAAEAVMSATPPTNIAKFRQFIATLNINQTAPKDTPYENESVAFFLANLGARKFMLMHDYYIIKQIDPKTLNCIITNGEYTGQSVASQIAALPGGARILAAADNNVLVKSINTRTLNEIALYGRNTGYSLAFWLSLTSEGRQLLALDNGRLANLINKAALNNPSHSEFLSGRSVAFNLSQTSHGLGLLAANGGALAKLISANTLNSTMETGDSMVFNLARCSEGIALLTADNYRLAKQIHPIRLNNTIEIIEFYGQSAAFQLACSPEGLALLAANQGALAQSISTETLNRIILSNSYLCESVAFWLARSPEGLALLAANQGALAQSISAETLNCLSSTANHAGQSLAFRLASSEDGIKLLLANDGKLASLISENSLNYHIPFGPFAGESVALRLAESAEGRALLIANDGLLAKRIDPDTLGKVIQKGLHTGQSLSLLLMIVKGGSEILEYIAQRKRPADETEAQVKRARTSTDPDFFTVSDEAQRSDAASVQHMTNAR